MWQIASKWILVSRRTCANSTYYPLYLRVSIVKLLTCSFISFLLLLQLSMFSIRSNNYPETKLKGHVQFKVHQFLKLTFQSWINKIEKGCPFPSPVIYSVEKSFNLLSRSIYLKPRFNVSTDNSLWLNISCPSFKSITR